MKVLVFTMFTPNLSSAFVNSWLWNTGNALVCLIAFEPRFQLSLIHLFSVKAESQRDTVVIREQLAKCGKLAELKAELKLLKKNKAKVKDIQKKLKAPERKEESEHTTESRESAADARQEKNKCPKYSQTC